MIERTEKNALREQAHLALSEDISNVIAKYFPNFDNNIDPATWQLLALFLDEAIHQLGENK